MNFFESKAKARSQTKNLIFLFGLAVLSLIILTNILVMALFGYLNLADQALSWQYIQEQFNWKVFAGISAVVVTFIFVASLFKISALSGGGKVVAKSLGGSLISHASDNLQYKVLLNVVEEMAIASGTPVPPVYVLRKESGINAFAAGFSVDDAVIGVTQGALDCFTREELQGVIAHEFSHIIHGDMRLNMRLIGILHGILLIGLLGYYVMHMSGSNSRSNKGNQAVFLGLGLVIIGYGGTFFGNAIKASVSRQREYLADASAVQYTRNNKGIANALKKIGGFPAGSKLDTSEAQTMSHAFFSNALTNKFNSLFATHPPLPKRIKELEPTWSGTFTQTRALNNTEIDHNAASISQFAPTAASANISQTRHNKTSQEFSNSVGEIKQSQLDIARTYLAQIPAALIEAVYTSTGAQAYVYALLLSDASAHRVKHSVKHKEKHSVVKGQLRYLSAHLPSNIYQKLDLMAEQVNALPVLYRLPLLEIALPNLRRMSRLRYEAFLLQMEHLIFADDRLSLFEWSIANIVSEYLHTEFETADKKQIKYKTIASVQSNIEAVLGVLMNQFCAPNEYSAILTHVSRILGTDIQLDSSQRVAGNEANSAVEEFAKAINTLQYLSFPLKEKVLQACIFAVTQDKVYTAQEHETIRALAECLGCPLPISNLKVTSH